MKPEGRRLLSKRTGEPGLKQRCSTRIGRSPFCLGWPLFLKSFSIYRNDLCAFTGGVAWGSDDVHAFAQALKHFNAVAVVAPYDDFLKMDGTVGLDDGDLGAIGPK